jgi:hypothetical protein
MIVEENARKWKIYFAGAVSAPGQVAGSPANGDFPQEK